MRSACLLLLALAAGTASAQPAAPGRGQLLYETHCIQCHDAQVHWRDGRAARDWASLRRWVDRWQAQVGQQWTAEDVDAVARHLNDSIYHFPMPRQQG